MNLTKEKLKLLWNNKKNIENKRVVEVLESLNNIEKFDESSLPATGHTEGFFGPAKDEITYGQDDGGGRASIDKMKSKFGKNYDKYIDSVCNIVNAPYNRDKYYRVFSNAGENSDYETGTTTVGINTPDNYFISNNYFNNIIEFIKKSNNEDTFSNLVGKDKIPLVLGWNDNHNDEDVNKQINILSKRYITKYLWMLGNREEVLAVYSLQSFWRIKESGLFEEFDLIDIEDDTEFDAFTKAWRVFSGKIFAELDISKSEEKLNFSKWLFSVSLSNEMDIKNISDLLTTGNQAVILWGPPGTGKTYESMAVVEELLKIDRPSNQTSEEKKKFDEEIEKKYLFSKQSKFEDNQGYYEIIQFHPNYTYEDFIGGVSPKITRRDVSYELRQGVFYKFCKKAQKNLNQEYIFIIDEINRAELSAVFGELLFALEYRGKHINLPHFGSFTIPENVYIIGTMNNVDKSLVTFDLALRRRFGFFKLMPKLDAIDKVLKGKVVSTSLKKYVNKCKELNKKIISDLDLGEDYQIGQAYFLKIKDFLSDEKDIGITSFDLEKLWVYNLEPLLEEYLGMNMEDDGIKTNLDNLKKFFVEDE